MSLSRRDMLKLSAGAGAALVLGRRPLSADTSFLDRLLAEDLLKKPIPSSGEMIPIVGIGTAGRFNPEQEGWTDEDRAMRKQVIQQLSELGGQLIDTAPSYGRGNAEPLIGELVEEVGNRDKLFLATKVRVREPGVEAGLEQIHASFQKLRTDVIDLMQVHNLADIDTQLGTIRELKQEGHIRYIGMTTSSYRQFEDFEAYMKKEDMDFVQINYSIVQRRAEERLLPLAADRGMAVLINLPYGRGRTFEAVGDAELPDWARGFADTWGQFFLKWIVSHPAVTCAIPGTYKMQYLEDNLGAAMGELPDEETRKRMVEFVEAQSAG